MDNLGPINCNLTSIGLDTGVSCYDRYKGRGGCNIFSTALYTTWHLYYQNGIIRTGPKIEEVCPNTNLSMMIDQATRRWSSHHSCYIDPNNDDKVSLDLIDMKASISHTSARFVSSMFFFAVLLLGFILLIISSKKHYIT